MRINAWMLLGIASMANAEVPASYERLFREQENHIRVLEDQLDSVARELAKHKAGAAELADLKGKHQGLLQNYDKLMSTKGKLEKELEKTKTQLADLKKYYVLEQQESELREKRVLKASSKAAEALQAREGKLRELEDRILKLTNELKESQARCLQLTQNYEAQNRLVANERASIKKSFDTLQQELVETHRLASLKNQELESAIKENRQLRRILDHSKTEIEKMYSAHTTAWKKKVELAELQVKEITKVAETRSKELTKLQATQTKEIEHLKAELEATNALLSTTVKTKDEAIEERTALKKSLTTDFEKFKEREIAAKDRESSLRAELGVLKAEYERLAASNQSRADAAALLTKHKTELEKLRKDIVAMGIREQGLLDENTALSKSNRTLTVKLAEAAHAIQYPTAIPAEVSAELYAKNRECTALRHRLKTLEAEHHNLCIATERDTDELRQSLDEIVREHRQVSAEKERLESELASVSEDFQATINEQDAAYVAHMNDVTADLLRRETSLEKMRHELLTTTGAAKKLTATHRKKLAAINQELESIHQQLAEAREQIAVKESAGAAFGAEHYAQLKELETTRTLLRQKEEAIAALTSELQKRADQLKTTRDKTKYLLNALGFKEGAQKEMQRTTFLKMMAERELESLQFDDLCAGTAKLSKGLATILSDSLVLGSMLEELGTLTAKATHRSGIFDKRLVQTNVARHCATLYKLFLARKQLTPDSTAQQRDIEPLFSQFATLASRQLNNNAIAQIKLNDITNPANPLVKALTGNEA